MTVYSIISKLDRAGIKVWVDSGQLKVKAPKGALTKTLKAELVEYKAELIQFLPSVEAMGKKEDAIPLVARDGDLALSFAQKRMWFLAQLEPGNTAYHIRTALEIRGGLDIHALQRALKKLMQRHESLRTTFVETDGVPKQRINPEAAFVLPVEQLGDENLIQIFSQFVDTPFDLESGPLFRAKLVQRTGDYYVLMIAMHHIISDGWSTSVMVSELSALYASSAMNVPDSLPPVALQYVDYAYWQKSWLSGEREDRQLKYWTQQLTDVPVLDLPTDFSRPPLKSTAGSILAFDIDAAVVKQAKTVAQQNSASVFMTLLSVFNCLLYRYTGQVDFAVGSPIANRTNAQLEGTVGLFVNTLAMRAHFEDGVTFSEHLSHVQATALDAYDHQDIPFERIVDSMGVSRDMSHTPVFQVMFVLQNTPGDARVKLPGVVVEELKIERDTSPMDMTMTLVEEKDGSITGQLEYCTSLFSPNTARQFSSHYVSLLRAVLNNPNQLVSEVDYLSVDEKLCLIDWGAQQQSYDETQTLDNLFEQSVKRFPNNAALTDGDQHLSYLELNDRANQLARQLVTLGVTSGSHVGISLERSANVLIAIIGVLKTGATYVPVDPTNPVERIQFVLDDARIKILITDSESKTVIPIEGRICVELDRLIVHPENGDACNNDSNTGSIDTDYDYDAGVGVATDGSDIAYVIYTSGTTGKPKGVQISHGNVARLFHATNSRYNFDDKDVWTLFHSYAFDFSVWEIWGALIYGGRLVIVPKMLARDPTAFYGLLQREKVTVLNQTPTAFTHLIKEDEAMSMELGKCPKLDLRYVIFGGEALDFSTLQNWVNRHGISTPKLINMYGITETTVHVSYHEVTEAELRFKRSLIGRPIDDLSLYILDTNCQPVPAGIAGEMYVGGAGLARGYLRRPDLTAERFIPLPAKLAALVNGVNRDKNKGGIDRLYKSGDVARYVRDEEQAGIIEYLGRADDQVKIRGFRIELGEIESTLTAHSKVHGSVATLYTDINGQDHIIAYVDGDGLNVAELKAYLQGILPEYMVPTRVIALARLPLTSNGKVDKKALPIPDFQLLAVEDLVVPSSDDEVALLSIWQEVLGISIISVDANFFEIGGHSLLATQVISRIRKLFSIELPLRAIFESPTIQSLAALVDHARQTQSGVDMPPELLPRPSDVKNVLTFAQHRLWFIDQLDQSISAYNLPVALLLTGDVSADDLEHAFHIILSRHTVLCTQYIENEGEPGTRYKDPSSWQLDRVALVKPANQTPTTQETVLSREIAEDSRIKSAIEEHADSLFDLANDWLFKAKLINYSANQHILLVNMHHVVSDGWSMGVLLKELKSLLDKNSVKADTPALLPALPIQYEDYAYWQRQWLNGDNLERLSQYWINALKGAPAVLRLPTDFPRPEKPTFNGAHLPIDLGVETTEALYRYCENNGVTPFMVLIAAYQILLGRYTHQEDICVGIPIANRNQVEIENLIGFFINGLIIRGQQHGNPTRQAFVESIKESALGAFAHQDMPMDVLVDALQMSGGGGYSPGAQVAFALQNMPNLDDLSLPGLEVELLNREHKTAKYELTLMLEEQGETISGVMEFNTDLFKQSTIELMATHYKNVLSQMLAEPKKTIAALDLVSYEDLKKILQCDQSDVDIAPLSPMQRDVYLDIMSEPSSLRNSIGSSCVFHREFDIELCNSAFEELVRQHPLMRAQLVTTELPYVDVAYFKIDNNRALSPTVDDFSSKEWSNEAISALVHKTVYQPYDLFEGELYRFHVFKLDRQRTLLVVSVCHLIADGAGLYNSFQDLFTLLHDLNDGNVPTDLNDNVHVQVNQSRQTFDSAKTIQYWEEKSVDLEALQFSVPTARTEKPERVEETIVFQGAEFEKVWHYCTEMSIHPATYFKVLYTLLLHYYCRPQSNFYFTEILGGRSKQFRHTFGCFFHTLPTIVPHELMGAENTIKEVIEFLQSYKMATRDVNKISQLGQRKILPRSEQEFLYNYYNFISEVTWENETATLQPHPQIQDGPVQFIAQEFEDHFLIQFVFNSGLFESLGFLDRLSQLSEQVTAGVEVLAELDFLLPLEKSRENMPSTNVVESRLFGGSTTVVDRIVQQCVDFPDAIAVKYDGSHITYAELNNRSGEWAGFFLDLGVRAGERVVVCLDPSLALYPVLLGILKAGATYVPIDADYPAERINYILQDSNARCLVTQECVHARLVDSGVEIDKNKLVLVESLLQNISQFSQMDTSEAYPSPNSIMYVIYTSGSTGKPKGAGVYHRGVANLLDWYIDELNITSEDACLLVSSVGFDLTQKNPWAAFSTGAKLVIPDMDHYDPDVIARTIAEESITWLNCAPSAFYPIVEEGDLFGYPYPSLRHVVLGGEPIRLASLNHWLRLDHGDVSLMNSYGPTECTDVVAAYPYSPSNAGSYTEGEQLMSLPIGCAIPNVELSIVNERNQALAPGFVGELCIAGIAVGAGYLDQPELTSEVFIDNPFGEGLLYKTGDLVRVIRQPEISAGSGSDLAQSGVLIEYIGRKDFQVKVRGLRIELGEIEFAIRRQDRVLDALVTVDKDQIIAYALSAGIDAQVDSELIRRGLRLSLPEFMVPHHVVVVDKWPLTPNGKIDRKALPAPIAQGKQEFVPPTTDSEVRLANIWCDVLNLERVGILDNFFDLGGHSLLAARVISKLRKEFKVEISLRVLFEVRTVRDIAEYIDRLSWAVQSHNHGLAVAEDQDDGGSDETVEEGFL